MKSVFSLFLLAFAFNSMALDFKVKVVEVKKDGAVEIKSTGGFGSSIPNTDCPSGHMVAPSEELFTQLSDLKGGDIVKMSATQISGGMNCHFLVRKVIKLN